MKPLGFWQTIKFATENIAPPKAIDRELAKYY